MTDITLNGHRLTDEQATDLHLRLRMTVSTFTLNGLDWPRDHEERVAGELLKLLSTPTPPAAPSETRPTQSGPAPLTDICQGCGNSIDREWCHCGASVASHSPYTDGHSPVPAGCTCGYTQTAAPSELAREPLEAHMNATWAKYVDTYGVQFDTDAERAAMLFGYRAVLSSTERMSVTPSDPPQEPVAHAIGSGTPFAWDLRWAGDVGYDGALQIARRHGFKLVPLYGAAALTRREPLRFPRAKGDDNVIDVQFLGGVIRRLGLIADIAEASILGAAILAAESLHNEGIAQDPLTEVASKAGAGSCPTSSDCEVAVFQCQQAALQCQMFPERFPHERARRTVETALTKAATYIEEVSANNEWLRARRNPDLTGQLDRLVRTVAAYAVEEEDTCRDPGSLLYLVGQEAGFDNSDLVRAAVEAYLARTRGPSLSHLSAQPGREESDV